MRKTILEEGIIDSQDNKVYLSDTGNIILKLAGTGDKRIIWALKQNGWEYYVEMRKSDRQIFRQNNSWGFNWELVNALPSNMVIVVRRAGKKYITTRYKLTVDKIKELGWFLHFMGEWFEKQIFVPIDKFYIDKP